MKMEISKNKDKTPTTGKYDLNSKISSKSREGGHNQFLKIMLIVKTSTLKKYEMKYWKIRTLNSDPQPYKRQLFQMPSLRAPVPNQLRKACWEIEKKAMVM